VRNELGFSAEFFYSLGITYAVWGIWEFLAILKAIWNQRVQWRSQGGALVHVPLVVVRVKNFLRAVDLDLLLLAVTHYRYWNCGLHGLLHEYELHAVIMIVQQNQFLVILVHLRCFVVICLTSLFSTQFCVF